MRSRIFLVPAAIAIAAAACSRDAKRTPAMKAAAPPADPPAPAVISRSATAYRVIAVPDAGTITGTILREGPAGAPATISTGADSDACGATVPDESVQGRGDALANAIVWLTDVRAGKPLPPQRRAELATSDCQVDPRVLAVAVGTTINVISEDATLHRTQFLADSSHRLLATIQTVDTWQVVPSAAIAAAPGLVDVRCVEHAFTRGYVGVFDHPYFAVTDDRGRFTLDGVPPGTYHLRLWHERGGPPRERTVTVAAGRATTVSDTLHLR
ncbi:MAG TPA: carboxypeptidase regulatory-like domain-containing protein [Gemmatimonadaceae bacterium]|nr:carboxypeptidase regulatory-like domain-containing protein [Gemmatimonadaceae bacterium]